MKHYFSHDEGARNDPKLLKVLMKLGQEGKGVYWDLIEMLYEQNGCLSLSECDSYAFALRTKSKVILSLINDFDLFKIDGDKFWSPSVLARMDKRDEKSKKASDSAKKRWNDANALPPQCKGNAIKEIKGNKSISMMESTLFNIKKFREYSFGKDEFTRLALSRTKRTQEELDAFLKNFLDEQEALVNHSWPSQKDARQHFINWVNKQPNLKEKPTYKLSAAAN